MGAPSCGKGVQADLIQKKFNLLPISTGQILRDCIKQKSEQNKKICAVINSGKLIKDDLMNKIVADKLEEMKNEDYILDGYPRTIKQTKFLLKHYCPDMVLYLQTDKEIALQRVSNRVICPTCKKSYSKIMLKTLICPDDKTELVTRDDDNLKIYLKRYVTFEKQTKPIIEMFKQYNILKIVDNNESVESTFNQIKEILELHEVKK